MIAAEVNVKYGRIYRDLDVVEWLIVNVGKVAPHRDSVDESRPWCITSHYLHDTYHFARAEDATLFALRWG